MTLIARDHAFNSSAWRGRVSFRSICQGRAASNLSWTVSWESSVVLLRSLFTVNYLSNRAKLRANGGHSREMKGNLIAFNRYTPECVRTCTCPLQRNVALRQINWRGLPLRHLWAFFRKPFTVHCTRTITGWNCTIHRSIPLSREGEFFLFLRQWRTMEIKLKNERRRNSLRSRTLHMLLL